MNEDDILHMVKQDEWMMEVLRVVKSMELPDWWIGAGFVRNKVWDHLHQHKKRTPLSDVDVIYFNPDDISIRTEKEYEKSLFLKMPHTPWSVKNTARIAKLRKDGPYAGSIDALSRWIETATCIAVKLDENNTLNLAAPLGINDLVELRLVYNTTSVSSKSEFLKRVKEKEWLEKWPKLAITL